MATEQLNAIRNRAIAKFDIRDAAIVHRLGQLNLGEASVAVVVVSAHRAAAFDACRWIIDEVKIDVPIWKKDLWADGSDSWVDPTCS
jgi:molybdopterin synthase catalytic subunit